MKMSLIEVEEDEWSNQDLADELFRKLSLSDDVIPKQNISVSEETKSHSLVPETVQETQKPKSVHANDPPSNVLWIGNVNSHITDRVLEEAFRPFGRIILAKTYPKIYSGFVNYYDVESAVRAKSAMDNQILCGQKIYVRFRKETEKEKERIRSGKKKDKQKKGSATSSPRSPPCDKPTTAVWIGNIDNITPNQLFQIGQTYGNVASAFVNADKRCAFINYFTEAEATLAVESLDGVVFGSNKIKTNYAKPFVPRNTHSETISEATVLPPVLELGLQNACQQCHRIDVQVSFLKPCQHRCCLTCMNNVSFGRPFCICPVCYAPIDTNM